MMRIRIPFLLYSYVATEILAPFFASVLIINGIFFLAKLIPFLNVVFDLGVGFRDFIRLFSYFFPNMLLYSLPMASMMGVIIAFTRLSNDSEILALKACGVSNARMFTPVILVALSTALLTGFVAVKLIPAGEQSLKKIMFQLVKDKVGKTMSENNFSENMGSFVAYVEAVDKESGLWSGVYVADMRFDGIPLITIAQSGYLEANEEELTLSLVFNDGSLHRVDERDSQTITFSRYELDIPLYSADIGATGEQKAGRKGMTMQELHENAMLLGVTSKHGRDLLMEFHRRLVLPAGCFILTLLGLPLGLSAGRGKKAVGIPLGLMFFVLYYVCFSYAKVLAEEQVLPVMWAMWLPNILFTGLTVRFLVRSAQDKPLYLLYFFSDLAAQIMSVFSKKKIDIIDSSEQQD